MQCGQSRKATSNRFFVYALELVLLYVSICSGKCILQEPAKTGKKPENLGLLKKQWFSIPGKGLHQLVVKSILMIYIYVIERSVDITEYEPGRP